MKPLILLFSLLLTTSLIAQEGTTLDEYRYFSKGYIYQMEMGLDAQKEGYMIKKLFQATNGCKLVGLYKKGQEAPKALLVILDQDQENIEYICVPNGKADPRVKELANSDQQKVPTKAIKDYQNAMNEFLFSALSNPNLKKPNKQMPQTLPIVYQKDETLVSRSANLDEYLRQAPSIQQEENSMNAKSINTSESKIYGEIATRNILESQAAATSTSKRGVVSIKVCVDRNGDVTTAKFTQRGSTTFNADLKKAALDAAKNIKFAKLDQTEQCGIISYKF